MYSSPANVVNSSLDFPDRPPVVQWLALRKVVGWNLQYPGLGVLWAQWQGWGNTAEPYTLQGCTF